MDSIICNAENKHMREKLKQFAGIRRKDYLLKTVTFSVFSMLIGFAFALYNGVLGIAYQSLWHGSIGVYYFLLAVIRAIIISLHSKKATGRHEQGAICCWKACFSIDDEMCYCKNRGFIIVDKPEFERQQEKSRIFPLFLR